MLYAWTIHNNNYQIIKKWFLTESPWIIKLQPINIIKLIITKSNGLDLLLVLFLIGFSSSLLLCWASRVLWAFGIFKTVTFCIDIFKNNNFLKTIFKNINFEELYFKNINFSKLFYKNNTLFETIWKMTVF